MTGRVALLRCAALGVVSGGRSQAGVAAVALTTPSGGAGLDAVIGNPWTKRVIALAAAGELVGDKLPATPSRLTPMAFMPRLAFGAASAAGLGRRLGEPTLVAAALGALGAATGSWLGARWRAVASTRLGSDLPGALIEDGATLGLAALAVRGH